MRYHDYHINEYRVSDRGKTITIELVYGYPENETDQSIIMFTDVALYNFIHTDNAIITDIYEVPISDFLQEFGLTVTEWNRMYRVSGFGGGVGQYKQYLQSEGYSVWQIESAIGFYGFVVAKAVENA